MSDIALAGNVGFSEAEVASELGEQRLNTLRSFLLGSPLLGLGWLMLIVCRPEMNINPLPAYILFSGALLSQKLGRKRRILATWIMLGSMVMANGLMVASVPKFGVVALGVPTVIASCFLLRDAWSLLVLAALTLVVAAGWQPAQADHAMDWYLANVLAVYLPAWLATWASGRAARDLVVSSLRGWGEARGALTEARERRAELYNVLRSLETAMYRIERINNELAVSRYQAETARAFKAKFVAKVSHEMRGPLNLIVGFSRMMTLYPEQYGEQLPSVYRADLDAVYRNSQHLASLVDDVLDLSQIEGKRLALIREVVDLNVAVIQETVEAVRPLARRKGLLLREELSPDELTVWADPVRMRQVMLNLLTNAVRFTERGWITVRSWREDDLVHVSVEDTGPGIAPSSLPELFKEFTQIFHHENREASGTGLGLCICKELVDLHGGRIWVESDVGKGTMFRFCVPCANSAAAYAHLQSTVESGPHRAADPICLVLHDDPSLLRSLARGFQRHHVVGVGQLTGLVRSVKEFQPKTVLCREQETPEVLRLLAQAKCNVPVLSFAEEEMQAHANLVGVMGYVVKPFTPEILHGMIEQIALPQTATILIVDDDPDAVRLLEQMLLLYSRDYAVLRAYSGEQALDQMLNTVPDLILLDIVMPEMDGKELMAEINKVPQLREVPVVVVSSADFAEKRPPLRSPISLLNARIPAPKVADCLETMLGLASALSPELESLESTLETTRDQPVCQSPDWPPSSVQVPAGSAQSRR